MESAKESLLKCYLEIKKARSDKDEVVLKHLYWNDGSGLKIDSIFAGKGFTGDKPVWSFKEATCEMKLDSRKEILRKYLKPIYDEYYYW